MSMRQLESAILSEAKTVFANSKLRLKDIMEWRMGEIKLHEGEVTAKLPLNGVWVAIKAEHDKRANP